MTTPNVSGFFNKSKEDFVWFIKRAVSDRKSDSHAELYHCLLKMFAEADTNNDGLVSKDSFSKLIDMAASIPCLYGDEALGSAKSEAEKEKSRQKMFATMDTKNSGVITFDEWYKFSIEYIASKTATLTPHPILDHGNKDEFSKFLAAAIQPGTAEHTELFWYLVEMFVENDGNKDGLVTKRPFASMVEMLVALPKKLGILHPDQGLYEEEETRRDARLNQLFDGANPRGDDKLTLDEWVKFAMGVYRMMVQCAVGFNKSKEDFIWFVKKAVTDKKSHAHGEMYQCLLKMFVDADTNRDGLVSKASFSKLIDIAIALPRKYGYPAFDTEVYLPQKFGCPAFDTEAYKTEEEKEVGRQKIFSSMDVKNTGVITFDEWLKFCQERIFAKIASLDPHPVLDHGNLEQFVEFIKTAVKPGTAEHTELYWFLLELFTESDSNQNGLVTVSDFPAMMDKLVATPKKLGVNQVDVKDLYADDATKRKENQLSLFKKHNPRADDKMCVDEWVKLAVEDVFMKMVM